MRKLFLILFVLAFGLAACGLHISIPINTITPGPTVTDQINVSLPADTSKAVDLTLDFGAGKLDLHPGSSALVTGTATYNVADFKPEITIDGSSVQIVQGNWKLNGIPNFTNLKNEWDLSLGTLPLNLTVEAGAYKAEYELGGLALTNLTIKDGAAESKLNFSSPNLAELKLLKYETGASNVSLTGLANANFDNLELNCGAGNYTLDFSGSLQHAGSVTVQTGVSNMTLVIPSAVAAQITVQGGLSNVSHDSAWKQNGNTYTQAGTGPQLTVVINIGAGNLTLTH
jgi:hypothetical protein